MTIGEVVIEACAALITLRNIYSAWARIKSGTGITWPSLSWLFLWALAVVCIPLLGVSPYHLLWFLPACLILSFSLLPVYFALKSLQWTTVSFLGLFAGYPQWASNLPQSLLLTKDQIRRLETIRKDYCIDHRQFHFHIASHPHTTRCVLECTYRTIRSSMPVAQERDVLKQLILSRFMATSAVGQDLFNLRSVENDRGRFTGRIEGIVMQYPDKGSLINAVIAEDMHREGWSSTAPGFESAVQRVKEILSESQFV